MGWHKESACFQRDEREIDGFKKSYKSCLCIRLNSSF